MRNKLLAATLLSASFAFAQYGDNGGSYNSYGSVWDGPSTQQASTPASESAEANTQSASEANNTNEAYSNDEYNNNPYGSQNNAQYSVQTYSSSNKKNSDREDRYTHARRGFYFSNSLTFGYQYLRYSDADPNYNGGYDIEDYKFKGFIMPYYEMRLGASIANWVSIYGSFGFAYGKGNFEYLEEDQYSNSTYSSSEHFKVDANNLKMAFACGAEIYPIHDKESPAYGLFFGIAGGFSVDGAFYEKTEYKSSYYYGNYEDTYSVSDAFVNFFARFEVGKDWWISRRWSFGVAFNYTVGGLDDSESYSSNHYYSDYDYYSEKNRESFAIHSFGLTLRLTH